jgi:outer membrane receptor protein involved in Fe transport
MLAYAVTSLLTGTGFAAAAPGVALAQEANDDTIEEILVTAQRRTQSLQDVPIAMQVVDRTLINDVAAENLGDLNGFVPDWLFRTTVRPSRATRFAASRRAISASAPIPRWVCMSMASMPPAPAHRCLRSTMSSASKF